MEAKKLSKEALLQGSLNRNRFLWRQVIKGGGNVLQLSGSRRAKKEQAEVFSQPKNIQ